MTKRIFGRVIPGIIFLLLVLFLLFTITRSVIHRWGATDSELALTLPGDELVEQPLISWTHAITIDARPDHVWQWIAQMGDTRAGFYSFTFIENQVGAITGTEDYDVTYVNANRIHPEWQNPQVGDQIIQDALKLREVKQGEYMLAESVTPEAMTWIWLWYLQPINSGEQTRLIVRFAIKLPEGMDNPAAGFMMDVGGFVMENRMLQGIRTRAEGRVEPPWLETAEIAIWVGNLAIGLFAAYLFVTREKWQVPLLAAFLSVFSMFILTFAQPPILHRLMMLIVLIIIIVNNIQWDIKIKNVTCL